MGDLTDKDSAQYVKVVGEDNGVETNPLKIDSSGRPTTRLIDPVTGLEPSIVLDGGFNKLRALADVTVNSLRGFDPIADTWFFIGTELNSKGVGAAGDTVIVEIDAGDDATQFPAVSVTTTVQAGDDEDILAGRIVNNLNLDANFTLRYRAQKLNKRATTVYITAKEPGPQGERPAIDAFRVYTTGTTTCTRAFQNLIRRQKTTSLARDPSDPTLGVLGISGSVTASQGEITSRFVEFFRDENGSNDMRVDGTIHKHFTIPTDPDEETFITHIRILASANGIKFGQFLASPTLVNGLELVLRSNNSELKFPPIRKTDDFLGVFAYGEENFNLFIQQGGDILRATLSFDAPVQLAKAGTFPIDDFIKVCVCDNLSSGLLSLNAMAVGFRREF